MRRCARSTQLVRALREDDDARRAARRAGRARRAREAAPGCGARGRGRGHGRAPAARPGGRPGRLPHPAGVADERAAARRGAAPRSRSATAATRSRSWSPTRLRDGAPRRPATGSSACGSAPRCSAASVDVDAGDGRFGVRARLPYWRGRAVSGDGSRAAGRRRRPHARRPARGALERRDDRGGRARRRTAAVAAARVRESRPDVVLMDIRMPDLDGVSATREVLAELPGCEGRGADHLRAGRLHLRRAQRGRLGVPAQADEAGGADRGDPHRRRGRLAPVAVRDAPRHRPDGDRSPHRPPRASGSTSSPRASARCSSSSRAGSRTARSRTRS